MESVRAQGQCTHFGTADFGAGRISTLGQSCLDSKTGRRARVPDQLDDSLPGPKRLASPVLRDVAEESMLYLVPLARAWWEVTHADSQARFVSKSLQFSL